MQPYQFPDSPHVRIHGPRGYSSYESYRDWLRDEFLFRCVYCLNREKWIPRRGYFHIDHWVSQDVAPERATEYENLLYTCAKCNFAKGNRAMPNPTTCLLQSSVNIYEDGSIEGLTSDAKRTILVLHLDSPEDVEFRSQLIGIHQLKERDFPKFLQWMGFPTDLPDLSTKNCPQNSRPQGLDKSCFARLQRGELPEYY